MTETKYSLRSLLAAPKGNLDYNPGDAFLLHVFWEAPSITAARELLSGLAQCANATHRDTPCTPTYFFRLSNNDDDLCSPTPRTVNDLPHLHAALKKIQVGVPLPVVHAGLTKCGYDTSLLSLSLDSELPEALQTRPVRVEFTELYLDEQAFMEHAGSRDYLDGYAVVMNPALHHTKPSTIRFGTPPASMVERILEPVLNETAIPLPQGCSVWRTPSTVQNTAAFLSLDVPGESAEAVVSNLQPGFEEYCTTLVVFVHPLRVKCIRVMCVLPSLPPQPILARLAALQPVRGEAHMNTNGDVESLRNGLAACGLSLVTVNDTESVGYVLHAQASDLREKTMLK